MGWRFGVCPGLEVWSLPEETGLEGLGLPEETGWRVCRRRRGGVGTMLVVCFELSYSVLFKMFLGRL